ncbi:MAG: nucleotidyl transferase AbiEii/AbiGii toxin family protein [bacterium]
MNDQLNVLRLVVERFKNIGIPYMLTGSTAMNFYAVPRMTRDIDIIAEISLKDVNGFYDVFRNDFYIEPDDISNAVKTCGSFNIIHNETLVKVDVLIRKHEAYRKLEFGRRKKQDISGFTMQVVSPEDLILSKLCWTKACESETQIKDVANIMGSVKDLDRKYMTEWAGRLGVADLLKKIMR